jgi:tRNA(Ile)-lysidine synthase
MALKTPISQVVQSVLECLTNLSDVNRYLVAFSGGIDSYVLLHVLATHRHQFADVDLLAVHINHALNINSDQWAARCQTMCEHLKVGFVGIDVDATPRSGESPEARARAVRYEAISRLFRTGDCLLTAHHQDDQVETLFLQLMRGSGPKGLSAMPEVSVFNDGLIARPFINVRRDAIQSYAVKHQLKWINDDSNLDTRFDRNFIRHEIIPKLQQRWPSLSQTVSRSARYCAEASDILESVARKAIDKINPYGSETLSVSALQEYSRAEQKNILRYWIQSRGLNTPSSSQLDQVVEQVLTAAVDATPRLTWEGSEVRRYRDKLYAFASLKEVDIDQPILWDLKQPLELDSMGTLEIVEGVGEGVARKHVKNNILTVDFRKGGEAIQPVGRKEKHALKKLFQESGVPPWIRERIPLIYIEGELAVVGGMFVSQKFHAQDSEDSYIFQWKSKQLGGSA